MTREISEVFALDLADFFAMGVFYDADYDFAVEKATVVSLSLAIPKTVLCSEKIACEIGIAN